MRVITGLVLFAFMQASAAKADKSIVLMRGIGFTDCSLYIAEQNSPENVTVVNQWIYGHWSAQNRYLAMFGNDMKDLMDSTVGPEPLAAQILAICEAEPNLQLVLAADRIFERLPDLSGGNLP